MRNIEKKIFIKRDILIVDVERSSKKHLNGYTCLL